MLRLQFPGLGNTTLKSNIQLVSKIVTINRVLECEEDYCTQSNFMLFTQMRTRATTEFEKDFYRLMNNSAYGKTIMNIRNRITYDE